MSLQRLPTSEDQWQRPSVSSTRQSPPLPVHEVRSVTSLPAAESHSFLPAPIDGGVRRLRQKLSGLVHSTPSGSTQPAGDLLGARLASTELLESPLMNNGRRFPLVREVAVSMTSLASSQSSSSDEDFESAEDCSGGFYEREMDILEHAGVEVCF